MFSSYSFITRYNSIFDGNFFWRQLRYKEDHQLFFRIVGIQVVLPQLTKNYSSNCGRGMFSTLHNTLWIIFLSMLPFNMFSSKNLYQMLGYLRKPAKMESPSKTPDVFFGDLISTAWEVSVFGVFLFRIFPRFDWIRIRKLRIRTLFTQWSPA